MPEKKAIENPEDISPIEIQLSEEEQDPTPQVAQVQVEQRNSSNECKIVGANTPELLTDPTKVMTHRKTIFGRGFIDLDSANDINVKNTAMLLVSDFEVKILKANQSSKEHSLIIE